MAWAYLCPKTKRDALLLTGAGAASNHLKCILGLAGVYGTTDQHSLIIQYFGVALDLLAAYYLLVAFLFLFSSLLVVVRRCFARWPSAVIPSVVR